MSIPHQVCEQPPARFGKIMCGLAAAAWLLLCGGCETAEMKGTPFYTGEYAKRNGQAEQRVNAWPVVYYRDPALSVLWPVFERTDDHFAVRPLFSVYGLDQSDREYNVLWPLSQFDRATGDNWIFPLFWGGDHVVVFPLYWHLDEPWGISGGTDSLFPLWILNRDGTNRFSFYCPWPVFHRWVDSSAHESGSMVLPLYWQGTDAQGSRFYSLVWMSGTETNGNYWRSLLPLFYQASNEMYSTTATLIWAKGRSQESDWQTFIPLVYWDRQQRTLISPLWAHWRDADSETSFAPWSLSWWTRCADRNDLWLAAGLAHASWGTNSGPHHVFPLYYRDASEKTLLTPLFGWDRDGGDYVYPFTPLVGVRVDEHAGSWLFPLYSHARQIKSGDVDNSFLLLGGNSRDGRHARSWFWPLYHYANDGPLDSVPEKGIRYATYGKSLWILPFHWIENRCRISPGENGSGLSTGQFPPAFDATTNAAVVREYTRRNTAFPFWSYSSKSTPARHTSEVKGSVGVLLYDYRHEVRPARDSKNGGTNDYTRARVLWRLWHYERLNGNVSVDVFPAITYDHKTDGFKKSSFLWRCYRYERAADGAKKLDLLFIPLIRTGPS
jgi:hypothetical protein